MFEHVVYLFLHEKYHFCMNSNKSTMFALTKFILGLENVFIFQVFFVSAQYELIHRGLESIHKLFVSTPRWYELIHNLSFIFFILCSVCSGSYNGWADTSLKSQFFKILCSVCSGSNNGWADI